MKKTRPLPTAILSTFSLKGKSVFSNVPKILPKNPPNCTISNSLVFHTFSLADDLFAKALGILET